MEVGRGKRKRMVERDEHMRQETTLEELSSLRPVFGEDSLVTAGNASGIVDGAAMMVLTTDEGVQGRAREAPRADSLLGDGRCGAFPNGHRSSSRDQTRALDRAGLSIDDLDLFEINEAFAGQILAVVREMDLDTSKLNVNGGAIALGHPLGATGTRLVLTLLKELQRRGGGKGVASACIGGGQGIAMIVEAFA